MLSQKVVGQTHSHLNAKLVLGIPKLVLYTLRTLCFNSGNHAYSR